MAAAKKELSNLDVILSSGYDIPGYRITSFQDLIHEEVIVGIGIATGLASKLGSAVAGFTGKEEKIFTEKMEAAVETLKNKAREKAASIGANCIYNIITESSINGALIIVSLTGTAVTVEKE